MWYTFVVVSFAQYKEYICLISYSKFSDVLPAFTCARAFDNLWKIYLEIKSLSTAPFVDFIPNIPILKALRVNSRPSKRAYALS